ncbi:hypothetical protein D3C72_1636370 [compost metagenome]
MRFKQPPAFVPPAQPAFGKARGVARQGQGQPMQAQGVALVTGQEVGQRLALHFQRGQRLADQAAHADTQPAGKGRVAADHAAAGIGPGNRSAEDVEGGREQRGSHCTNVVQNGGD